jgi:hypothetical protein
MTKAEELINKHLDRLDANNIIGKDGNIYKGFLNAINEAINFIPCCTELKTVEQGENLILDDKFDVQVVTPESSVLIRHKEKDRLIWVDKQRLKRK